MFRKSLSILLALVMVLSVIFVLPFSTAAKETDIAESGTSKTQAEALAWVRAQVGKSIDTDGFPSDQPYQCVDLIRAYYSYLGVDMVSGNGGDYTWNALPSGWQRLQGAQPQPGDVLVYTDGGFGHVAIYESDRLTYHQNFAYHPYVETITYAYNGLTVSYWGVIRPNFGSGNNPVGDLNSATGGRGTVSIRGWAFDSDDYNSQLNIHVYIGGPSGDSNAEGHGLTIANTSRPDVNDLYGCGNNHGFDDVIKTSKTGTQKVYVYAINVGGGQNVLIGEATVNITPDTQTIISDLNSVTGGTGTVRIRGWAFVIEDYSAQLDIHVYIGGPSGDSNAEFHGQTIANSSRPDVNDFYGCGNNHGFDDVIKISKTGTQKVYVYAINSGSGQNVLIGEATVNITQDNDKTILGDVDGDEEVSILDVTLIQRHLASMQTKTFNATAADVDKDGDVSILDVTMIQRHLANMPVPVEGIGEPK